MKFLYTFLLSAFLFIVVSSDTSALTVFDVQLEPTVVYNGPIYEYLGFTYDEFFSYLDNVGPYIMNYHSVFNVENPDWIIDSPIMLTDGKVRYYCNRTSYPLQENRLLAMGETSTHHNMIDVELVLDNNGSLLFAEPGRLCLLIASLSTDVSYSVYRSDGSSYSSPLSYGVTDYQEIPIYIDNSDNDLVKVVINYNAPVDNLITSGVLKYSYVYVEPEEPEPEEPPIIISGDLNGTIMYMLSFIISVVNVFFILEIIPGVTLGYFILACMIMSLVFSFFFHRMIK